MLVVLKCAILLYRLLVVNKKMIMKKVWKVWLDQTQVQNTPLESRGLLVEGENFDEVVAKVKETFPEANILSISLEASQLL